MTTLSKRKLTIIGAIAVLLVGAGIAYAYWTADGGGSGTAQTGTNNSITVNQTSTIEGLAPGGAPQTLSGDFTNTNDGPVFVSTVTVSIDSVVKADGAPTGTCDATDYTLTNPEMTVNAEVPAGTNVGSWSGATIQFNNKPDVNQDGCKLATVNLAYTIP